MADLIPAVVDEYVRGRMAEHHIAGFGLAVVKDGQPVARAYGAANLEWIAPATSDTTFQLASVTKLLTATVVMLLVQDGMLGLDASVKEYLPDAPSAWEAITVRRLASHTSGLGD